MFDTNQKGKQRKILPCRDFFQSSNFSGLVGATLTPNIVGQASLVRSGACRSQGHLSTYKDRTRGQR